MSKAFIDLFRAGKVPFGDESKRQSQADFLERTFETGQVEAAK